MFFGSPKALSVRYDAGQMKLRRFAAFLSQRGSRPLHYNAHGLAFGLEVVGAIQRRGQCWVEAQHGLGPVA